MLYTLNNFNLCDTHMLLTYYIRMWKSCCLNVSRQNQAAKILHSNEEIKKT